MPLHFNFDFYCQLIAVIALLSSFLLLIFPKRLLHWRTYAALACGLALYAVIISLHFGVSEPGSKTLLLSFIGMQMLALVPVAKKTV